MTLLIIGAIPAYPELLIFPELRSIGFGNPAREVRGVHTAYGAWFTDSKVFSFGWGGGHWALGAAYMDFGALEFQDETPDDAGGPLFRPYAAALSAQASFRVDTLTRAGLALGVLQERVFDQERWDVFLNLGLEGHPKEWLWWEAFLRNLGAEKMRAEALVMPTQFGLGVRGERGSVQAGLLYARVPRYGSWLSFDQLGTELKLWLAGRVGPTVLGLSYTYGREIDPVEASLGVEWGSWQLSYRLRPGFGGFDWPHLVNFTFLP